jgi:hypothetical protein
MNEVKGCSNGAAPFESILPMEMTIEDTLKSRSDERRKLKEFNYSIIISKLTELEKNQLTKD